MTSVLAVNSTPYTNGSLGPDLAWRMATHFRIDETAMAASDRRFSCRTAEGPGRTFATVLDCPSVAALSPNLRALLGITAAAGPAMIIGGGSVGAGAVYEDPRFPGSLAELVRRETAERADPDLFVVAPSVPEYVPPESLVTDGAVRLGTGRSWYYRRLGEYPTMPEYVAGQPRGVRRTLARDIRVAEELSVSIGPLTADHPRLRDAVALFTAVERNNGELADARLTAWRVRTLMRAARRSFLVEVAPAPEAEPICYTLLRELVPDVLDVSMIGIADGTAGRRDVYHVGAFMLPLQFAISQGFDLAVFGREHAVPKKLRGLEELGGVDVYPGP